MKILLYILPLFFVSLGSCSDKLRSLDDTAIEVNSVNGEEISFSKNITSGDKQFAIATGGLGSIRYLDIRASKNGVLLGKIDDELEGMVYETITGDLNQNSKPEILLLMIKNAYEGKIDVVGFEFDGTLFKRFELPALDEELAFGYEGKDHFYISKSKLVREFPIHSVKADAKRRIFYVLNKGLVLSLDKFEVLN